MLEHRIVIICEGCDIPDGGSRLGGAGSRSIAEVIRMVEPLHLDKRGRVGVITELKGFLDESGTHGGSKSTVMAGFVGSEDQWLHLEAKWKNLLSRHPKIASIHGKDHLLPKRGNYFKWPEDKYTALIEELSAIVYEANIFSVLCVLHNDDYRSYRKLWKGTKYSPDSAYGVCFRACLGSLASAVMQDAPGHRLSMILESGHKNRNEAHDIFEWTKQRLPGLLGNLAFAAKEEYGALQAADLHAYGSYIHFSAVKR